MVGLIRSLVERNLPLTDYGAWQRGGFTLSSLSSAGRTVTPATAMRSVAVFACVRVLAETIGTLPLITYRRLSPRGKERDPGNPLYQVLHDLPNPEMSSVELRETIVGHLALRGNAYLEIVRDGGGRVRELWPLRPDQMAVERERPGGPLKYVYTLQGREVPIPADRICHIRGLSSDGVHGYSPVAMARDAIGLAQAAEEYGARWFSGGARPSGVLQVQGKLSQEAANRLRDSWNTAHAGLDHAQRVAVLEEGVSWQAIGVPPEDAQFLETRRFQVIEIARLYRVPPHMIQDLERATFTNIEHQSLDFVVHTIRPWLVRIEQAFQRALFGLPSSSFCEFLVDGLLRGDLPSRYQAYATGRNWGWLSANDVREIENLNPIPDGDIYLQPLNMVEAGATVEEIDEQEEDVGGQNQPRSLALPESRAIGSAASRRRLAVQYRRLFVDMAARIARREAAEVRAAAERLLNRRDLVDFRNWLREYYERFGETATRIAMPTFLAYAEAVLTDAAAEIDSDDLMLADLSDWLTIYGEKFGTHWAGKSWGQLESVLREAEAEDADQLAAVTTRLDEWTEKRPGKVADLETTMLSAAISAERWKRGGILRIRWIAHGQNCAFCSRINGRVVGIEQTFAAEGDELEGAPGQSKLRVKRPTKHPPIHGGCDCGLKPERA